MLEIRPTIKWDKGKALEFLLDSLGEWILMKELLLCESVKLSVYLHSESVLQD